MIDWPFVARRALVALAAGLFSVAVLALFVESVQRGHYEQWVSLAAQDQDRGRLASAMNYCAWAIARSPDRPEAYALRANIEARAGRVPEGIGDYSRAIELRPNDPANYYSRGNLYAILATQQQYSEKDYDRAMADFAETLTLDDTFTPARESRASLKIAKGQWGSALQDCREAIQRNPNSVAAHLNAALALNGLEDCDRALVELGFVLILDPENFKAHALRVEVLLKLGRKAPKRYEEAEQACGRLIELSPKSFHHFYRRAFIRAVYLGRYAEALDDLATVQTLNPDFLPAILLRAHTLACQGDREGALRDFMTAAIKGATPRTRQEAGLGVAFMNLLQGRPAKADSELARILKEPDKDFIADVAAFLSGRLGLDELLAKAAALSESERAGAATLARLAAGILELSRGGPKAGDALDRCVRDAPSDDLWAALARAELRRLEAKVPSKKD